MTSFTIFIGLYKNMKRTITFSFLKETGKISYQVANGMINICSKQS